MPRLAIKTGRHCCHQLLFKIRLHALFKTANFVTNMKFKGLEQQNLSTDSTVTAVTGLKVGVLTRPGVSVRPLLLNCMPFLIFGSLLDMKW